MASSRQARRAQPTSKAESWRRYDHHDIHWALIAKVAKDYVANNSAPDSYVDRQALFCPYYVVLDGVLGMDWGVIVNPESSRFGLLTFEHDFCGCPPHVEGSQKTDEWLDRDLTDRNRTARAESYRVEAVTATVATPPVTVLNNEGSNEK